MKRLSLVLTLLLFSVASLVAQRTITGKVVDDQNEPLIGASILVKGTSTGTVTDIDGSYSIAVPAGSNVLIFSYTGYTSKEVTVGASNVLDVTLEQESTLLSEIVVTGYSEVERKKLVASIAVVDDKAINNVPMPDVNQLIQGRATGVLSSAPSGQPGAQQTIRIRGTGSINAGRGPLYVIDGIIVETGNFTQTTNTNDVLSNLNPNDIDNVTILKDAAATALYGSRGANGVVLINTKRGKAGRSVITVKGQYGVTQPNTGKFELMNADEIWNYERKVLANSGRTPEQIEAARPVSLLNNAFDWVDAAFRTGNTYNLEAQASGGNEKTRFFASAGYFKQDGILIESDFSRLSLRTNIDHRATDKLDFQVNLNGSYTDNLNAVAGNRFASPLLGAFVNTPLQPATDPVTGKLYTGQETAWTIFSRDNFLYSQPLNPVINRNFRLISKAAMNYNILKGLRFSQTAAIDYIVVTDYNYFDATTNDGIDTNGQVNDGYSDNRTLTTQSSLKYVKAIGEKHEIDALGVFEYQKVDSKNFFASGSGLASGKLKTLSSTAKPESVSGSNSEYAFVSLLGQLNYSFMSKYLLTANVRRDGSSRFGANNRYATFYSVGGSWILSEEGFLNNLSFLSNLRLRASYGTTGNASIGNFASLQLYGFGASYDDLPGSTPSQIGNPDLTWEITKSINLGLDFGLFQNRISGTLEYYRREGQDLLLAVPVSSTSGFTTATRNIGRIENKGIELTLNYSPFRSSSPSGFNWDIELNFTANDNKVLELPNDEDILNGNQVYRVGLPIRSWYLREWAGVDPANGQPLWRLNDEGGTTNTLASAPRYIVGNAEPDFIAGLNNTFSYKNFSLSAFIYTVQGNEVYNGSRPFVESDGQRYGQFNNIVQAADAWEKPGDIATRPQPRVGGNRSSNGTSSRYLEDGSFIRLRNVTLGYSLPRSIVDKARLAGITAYIQGQNLITITDYSGFDPEMGEDGSEFFRYPVGRSLTFGLDISF